MRFFSNDKDDRDDQQGVDVRERAEDVNPDQAHDDHPERVQSDPVAVPQQRAGSPWSSTPDTVDGPASGDASDPRDDASGLRDDPSGSGDDSSGVRDDSSGVRDDSSGVRDDADAELADQERQDGTVDRATDDTVTDGTPVDGHDDALRPDDSEVRHDGDDLVPSDASATATSDTGTGSHRADLDQPVDLPLDDDERVREDGTPPDHAVSDTAPDATVTDSATTTTYGPDGTVTTTDAGDARDEDSPAEDSTTDSALKDDGGFADPQAVDPVTEQPLDSGDRDSDSDRADSAAEVPVVAAVPIAAAAVPAATAPPAAETPAADSRPGSVPAPDLETIFAADDAQSFHDRWRDVQLRFVDSPQEATSEAARLVEEAVDKLTASLKSQKEALSGDHGEDTEKLRMELRGYRDILNRILAL